MKYKCPHCSAQNSCRDSYILYNDVQCTSCLKVFRLADANHKKGFIGSFIDDFSRSAWNAAGAPFTGCPYCFARIFYDSPRNDGTISLPTVCHSCQSDLPGPYDDDDNNNIYPTGEDPFPDRTNLDNQQEPEEPEIVAEIPSLPLKEIKPEVIEEPKVKKEEPSHSVEDVIKKCRQFYRKEKAKNGGKDLTEEQFMSLLSKIK
ncbi:MAG: hypothetical protein WCG45_00465 [bacterium]